jgi:hypothetical protein
LSAKIFGIVPAFFEGEYLYGRVPEWLENQRNIKSITTGTVHVNQTAVTTYAGPPSHRTRSRVQAILEVKPLAVLISGLRSGCKNPVEDTIFICVWSWTGKLAFVGSSGAK